MRRHLWALVALLLTASRGQLQRVVPPPLRNSSVLCDLAECGPLKVHANGHHLAYANGEPFYYVAGVGRATPSLRPEASSLAALATEFRARRQHGCANSANRPHRPRTVPTGSFYPTHRTLFPGRHAVAPRRRAVAGGRPSLPRRAPGAGVQCDAALGASDESRPAEPGHEPGAGPHARNGGAE